MNDYLQWRIVEYAKMSKISSALNKKADTYIFLHKLSSLMTNLIRKYSYDSVKTVIVFTILYRHIPTTNTILCWAKDYDTSLFDKMTDKRDFYELALKCSPKTVNKIATDLIIKESIKKRGIEAIIQLLSDIVFPTESIIQKYKI